MRIIGRTNDNNAMVEMADRELKELSILVKAIEGKTIDQMFIGDTSPYYINEYDFTGVFGAIRAFYQAQFRINEFRQLLDEMQTSLDKDA